MIHYSPGREREYLQTMTGSKHLLRGVAVCVVAAWASAAPSGCTDAELYKWRTEPYQPNKLTLSGNVCTDDLHQTDFPIKILFMIDVSQALKSPVNDQYGRRGKAIEDVINLWGKNPNYHFGIAVYGSRAKNLLTDSTGTKPVGFTRDMSKLLAAAQLVKSGSSFTDISACRAGRCRDMRSAVSLANSIISGDILKGDPGVVARTTYVMIMFAGGPPVPALGRCACRKPEEEKAGGKWAKCKWTECSSCKVRCATTLAECQKQFALDYAGCSVCDGNICVPVCKNSSTTTVKSCDSDEYCNSNFLCVEGKPVNKPSVQPMGSLPPSQPDTFTFRIPPPGSGACKSMTCVYDPKTGDGHTESCEEKVLVLDVRELQNFAVQNGAGQFQLHTTYLPDKATRQPTDPYYPAGPGACAGDKKAEQARTVRLLSQMAYAGSGGFQKFASADQIPPGFLKIGRDIYNSQDALVFKELVVFNHNVLADGTGIKPDTDGDGLTDDVEKSIGTCLSDRDSDGDGIGDGVEVKLASDPLKAAAPVECADLVPSQEIGDDPCSPDPQNPVQKKWAVYAPDQDRDTFNPCEERLLGTDDSLFDTDADGIPDHVEFVSGTNYLAVDPLLDADMDGQVNREEIRGHTDARSNDTQTALDLAYRYEQVDEGLKEVLSFTQPKLIKGIKIKNVSASTSPGVGWLKFLPKKPCSKNSDCDHGLKCQGGSCPPALAWRDYGDMDTGGDYGPAVDITKTAKDGYRLTSCRLKGKKGGGCTEDSAKKFITVLVDGEKHYGKTMLTEQINISSARRNCLRFTVRNITLLETGMDRHLGTRGNNTVMVYFAEAPENAKSGYGIFRIAPQLLTYTDGPPAARKPKAAEITLADDDFTLDIKQ